MSSNQQLIPITYSTSQMAHMAKAVLDEEGISCAIDGDQISDAFSFYGSAVCKVNLLVNEKDFERVSELLRELDEQLKPLPPDRWAELAKGWVCESCAEVNELNFEQCWSCSTLRPENPETAALENEEIVEPIAADFTDDEVIRSQDESPFRPPASNTNVAAVVDRELQARAARTALVGFILPPVTPYAAIVCAKCIASGNGSQKTWIAFLASIFLCIAYAGIFLLRFQ